MTNRKKVEAAARAMARVFSNGGDPESPAIRWNGTQMEPQEFPVWHDYRDEAIVIVEAIETVPFDGSLTALQQQLSSPLTKAAGEMLTLLRKVHDDLLLRAKIKNEGDPVIDLSNTLWNRLCDAVEAKGEQQEG